MLISRRVAVSSGTYYIKVPRKTMKLPDIVTATIISVNFKPCRQLTFTAKIGKYNMLRIPKSIVKLLGIKKGDIVKIDIFPA